DVPLTPDLNAKVEHKEIPREESENPARFTKQEETVWIRDSSRADRLVPQLDEEGNEIPRLNEAVKEIANVTGLDISMQDDPLGFLRYFKAFGFFGMVGVLGLFLAFGHSVLALGGGGALAQGY